MLPVTTLASGDEEMMFVFLAAILAFVVYVIAATVRSVLRDRVREESRREIAAYVAEGTISPADAERLLEAGGKDQNKACADRRLA